MKTSAPVAAHCDIRVSMTRGRRHSDGKNSPWKLLKILTTKSTMSLKDASEDTVSGLDQNGSDVVHLLAMMRVKPTVDELVTDGRYVR